MSPEIASVRVQVGPGPSDPTKPWTERYQTLMSAAVGFAGIIFTLVVNGALARRQARDAEARERQALRRALKAELGVIRKSLIDGAQTAKEAQSDGSKRLFVPTTSITAIYDASHAKLGLLDSSGIGVLVSTYALIKELPSKLALVSTTPEIVQLSGFVSVPAARFEVAEKMLRIAAEEAEKAIKALGPDPA